MSYFDEWQAHTNVDKAEAALHAARKTIAQELPGATGEEIDAFLNSEYGAAAATQTFRDGTAFADQIRFRRARFMRHFGEVQRRLKLQQQENPLS